MRIIGGKHKGRQLHPPQGLPVRPTTDQAKEGLFNILAHRGLLTDARVLELFAGTGNVSYEFWSRGAASITAVDQHAACVRYIQATFKELAVAGQAIAAPAERFTDKAQEQWDIIFMDPPYAWSGVPALLDKVWERELLAPDGLLIVEQASATSLAGLRYFLESRKYGGSSFSFFSPTPA